MTGLRSCFSFALAALVLVILGSGCASRIEAQGTDLAAGADAEIVVSPDGLNHRVELEAEHLPPPSRVSSGASYYVIWLKPNDRAVSVQGVLELDADEREGHAELVTPHRSFELFVTAERTRLPHSPSDRVVLRKLVRIDS